MSACHSGSATPNSRGASIATSIRSRCPALLRLPSAVAADARCSRGSWDKRAAAPRRRWPQQICQQFAQHAFRSCGSCSYRCLLYESFDVAAEKTPSSPRRTPGPIPRCPINRAPAAETGNQRRWLWVPAFAGTTSWFGNVGKGALAPRPPMFSEGRNVGPCSAILA